MNVEELRDYCISLAGVVENHPWTEPEYVMLVTFTVGGKWFCLVDLDNKFINVKCAPETISEMQSRYQGAFPAWHMNKTHWLGIHLESDVPDALIRSILKNGYDLIVAKLPKKFRGELLGSK